ncbi:MAG: hypothetical protein V1882_09600 [Candidatus Omnitrophota bacterium]
MFLKRGFALITVLAIVIAIALGSATLLRSMGNVANMKTNIVGEIQSQYLSEAGMQYAMWLCRTASGVCPASVAYSIDGTNVAITATTLTPTTFYAITTAVTYTDL